MRVCQLLAAAAVGGGGAGRGRAGARRLQLQLAAPPRPTTLHASGGAPRLTPLRALQVVRPDAVPAGASRVAHAPLRDFVGMEDADADTRRALLDFSYHMVSGATRAPLCLCRRRRGGMSK